MADAAARREARRRRILENSQNRIHLITGRTDVASTTESSIFHKLPAETRTDTFQFESYNSPIHNGNPSQIVETENVPQVNEGRTDPSYDAAFITNFLNNLPQTEEPSTVLKETKIDKFLSCKFDIILLSMLVQILYCFQGELITGISIFLPLIIFDLTKMFVMPLREKSSMLSALLLMNGISPVKVKQIMVAMQIIVKFLEDVSIYLFMIVITQALVLSVKDDSNNKMPISS